MRNEGKVPSVLAMKNTGKILHSDGVDRAVRAVATIATVRM